MKKRNIIAFLFIFICAGFLSAGSKGGGASPTGFSSSVSQSSSTATVTLYLDYDDGDRENLGHMNFSGITGSYGNSNNDIFFINSYAELTYMVLPQVDIVLKNENGSTVGSYTYSDACSEARGNAVSSYTRTPSPAWKITPGSVITITSRATAYNGSITFHFYQDITKPQITFNQASGVWTKAANVEVIASGSDSGSGVNEGSWRNSTDGFVTRDSQRKNIVVSEEGSFNYQFKVNDNIGNEATSDNFIVNIDRQNPVLKVTGPAEKTWLKDSATLSVTAEDVGNSGINSNTYKYSINDGNEITGSSVTLNTQGSYDVKFSVNDNAGNKGSSSVYTVYVDTSFPEIKLSGADDNSWRNDSKVTITASATDSGSEVNTASWKNSADNYATSADSNNSVDFTSEGKHSVAFKVSDNVGHEKDSKTLTFYIDRTPPKITLNTPEQKVWLKDTATVSAIAVDELSNNVASKVNNSTIKYSVWNENEQESGKTTSGSSFTQTVHGKYKVKFYADDNAGNTGESAVATIYVDTSNPVLTVSGDIDGNWRNKDAVINSSATDTGSGVNEETWKNSTNNYQDQKNANNKVTVSEEGNHTVAFKVSDMLGHEGNSENVTVKIDKTNPVITLSGDINGEWKKDSGTVTASAVDPINASVNEVSGVNENTWNYEYKNLKTKKVTNGIGKTVTISQQGNYELKFYVNDYAGNTGVSETIKLNVDTEKPVISVNPLTEWQKKDVYFKVSATDTEGSGINNSKWKVKKWLNNEAEPENFTQFTNVNVSENSITIEVKEQGEYSVKILFEDNVGHQVESGPYYINLDKTRPEISLKHNTDEKWINKDTLISAEFSDLGGSKLNKASLKFSEIIQNGNPVWKTYNELVKEDWTTSYTVKNEGHYDIQFYIEDNAKNNITSNVISFNVDKTKPSITLSGFENLPKEKNKIFAKNEVILKIHTFDTNSKVINSGINTAKIYYHYVYNNEVFADYFMPSDVINGDVLLPFDKPGNYSNIYFTVEDIAGNISDKTYISEKTVIIYDEEIPVFTNASFKTYAFNTVISVESTDFPENIDLQSGVNEETYRYTYKRNFNDADGNHDVKVEGKGSSILINKENQPEEFTEEGDYTDITFTVEDKAGNKIVPYVIDRIVIDTTPPVFIPSGEDLNTAIEMYYNDEFVPDGEAVGDVTKNPFTMEISADDRYDISKKGTIKKYVYYLSKAELTEDELNALAKSDFRDAQFVKDLNGNDITGNEGKGIITLTNLNQGNNYVYIKIVDEADNYSIQTVKKHVLLDNGEPMPPKFGEGSITFAQNASNAYRKNKGNFIAQATKVPKTGISSFKYFITKKSIIKETKLDLSDLNYTDFFLYGETKTKKSECNIEVTDLTYAYVYNGQIIDRKDVYGQPSKAEDGLEDSAENEFYYITALIVGGNGIEGFAAERKFRIDTMAPSKLTIDVSPQNNQYINKNYELNSFYNSENALVSWNKPVDITGVERYEMYVYVDGTEIENSPFVYKNELGTTERVLNKKTGKVDEIVTVKKNLAVKEIFSSLQKSYGVLTLKVIAYDYAGNCTDDPENEGQTYSFYSDYSIPEISGLEIVPDAEGTGVIVNWSNVSDTGSGLKNIEINFEKFYSLTGNYDNSRSLTLTTTDFDEPYIINTLDAGSAYYFNIRVIDNAQNSCVLQQEVQLGDFEIPEEARNLEINIGKKVYKGLVITGTEYFRLGDDTHHLKNGTISVPEKVIITEIKPDGSKVILNTLPLSDDAVYANDNLLFAKIVTAEGSVYETTVNGVTFKNPGFVYTLEEGIQAVNTTMYIKSSSSDEVLFKNLIIGFGDYVNLSSSEEIYEEPSVINTTGFDIYNVSSVKVEDKNVLLNPAAEGTYFSEELIDLKYKTNDGEVISENMTELSGAKIDVVTDKQSSEYYSYGTVKIFEDRDLILTLNNTEYIIKSAGISGNKFTVYEAFVKLPEEYEPNTLLLRNFSIDRRTGKVILENDFGKYSLSVLENGKPVVKDGDLWIDENGRLVLSGLINLSDCYSEALMEDLVVTNNGIDMTNGCKINAYGITLFGFTINITGAVYSRNELKITKGTLPAYGTDFLITNLRIDTRKPDTVYEESFAIGTSNGGTDSGYGAASDIKNIIVGMDGYYIQELTVPVYNSNGYTDWLFERVGINSDLSFNALSEKNLTLEIAGFNISTSKVLFDGRKITVSECIVTSSAEGNFTNSFVLKDIELNYSGIISGGKTDKFNYSFDGWNAEFNSLGLTLEGLKGRALFHSENIEKNYVSNLVFDEFVITSDGTINNGKISTNEGENIIIKDNFCFEMIEGNFVKNSESLIYEFVSEKPVIRIPYEDEKNLEFAKIVVTSEGSLKNKKESTKLISFVSQNGYDIESNSLLFKDGNVVIKGKIAPYGWDKIEVSKEIIINPDFTAEVGKTDDVIEYTYADWNIKGRGLDFGLDYFTIDSNKVNFRNVELELGRIVYYPDGTLYEEAVKNQNLNIQILSQKSLIKETRFTDEGLYASMDVVFPEMLGEGEIEYNSIKFLQNGKFSADLNIEHKTVDLNYLKFDLNYLSLSDEGLYIDEASINIPELQNLTIGLEGLSISSSGKISLKGAVTSPFELFNMVFCISNLSFDDNLLDFSGTISLPSELPGILSSRTVGIRKFQIGLNDGKLKALDARLEGEYVIPFLEQWSMSITSVGVSYKENTPGIIFDQAKLIVPAGYGLDSLEIDKVALNYDFGAGKFNFDFDKIQANLNLQTDISGITFSLNKVFITKEMSFGFGGNAYFGSKDFPEFLYGKSVKINTFEIKSNGNIGNIDIALNGLDGKIAPNIDVLELKDGYVRVRKEADNSLFVSVSGALQFTDKAIPELKGIALRLENFEIDTSKPVITELKAYNSRMINGEWVKDPAKINWDPVLFGNKFNDVFVSFEYDGLNKTGEVTLAGGLILPSTLPEGIADSEVRLDVFKIGLDGKIKAFAAGYSTPKTSIGAVDLTDVKIKVEYKNSNVEYDIDTTLTLPKEKFPEGIGGTSTRARFVFTSKELKLIDCSCSIPDQKLLNCLEMKGVNLSLKKAGSASMSISLAGGLRLPDSFPQGLAGMELRINELTMRTDGTFDVVDVGAANINALIFNQLQLSKGSINFAKGIGQELIINVGGSLKFTGSNIPSDLRSVSFGIDELKLSTKKGLVSFSAGMTGDLKCRVLGGIDLSISKLWFTKDNFTISATAGLNFPGVTFVNNPTFGASVTMGWNGEITNFSGGLDSVAVKVAGFTGSVKKLYVGRQNSSSPLMLTLDEFRITMPDNLGSLGGKSIALKNTTFNPTNGKFNGDIELPSFETTIVGFTLIMDGPSLNFTSNSIGFTSVSMKLPSFLGNASVALYDVKVSRTNGLTFGGGAFTLPDFKVGELGFKNVGAEFMLNGNQYYINGHGGVNIPGAGMLEAQLSFTNKSEMYPIGLERAYFSYEIATGGIPLGTTGLYLSGIRGGLAYGPPKEVPETYRGLFGENGTRLQLGLTVKDQTGGSLARVLADTWIDVTKLAWAFQGDATILSGTLNINAYVYAALTKNVFATGMKVQILFVKGKIEVYIFGLDGKLKFSGCGEVSFGMPKGYLFDGNLIHIPTHDIWLGGFGCMFGDFTNGKRGFLGYIDINIGSFNLGRVGAFVGSGGLDIKVKNYDILRPAGISFSQTTLRTPVVNVMEKNEKNSTASNTYTVNIKGGKQRTFIPFDSPMASGQENENITEDVLNNETEEDSTSAELQKTVFILGFTEGDPEFILHSPSGKEYKAGEPNVSTEYVEGGILIEVESPETGNWTITVNNLEEGQFELTTLGVEKTPEVTVEEPSDGIFAVTDQMYVKGFTTNVNAPVYIYASEDSSSPAISIGYVMSDEYGNYEGYISTDNIPDGDYVLSARVLDSEGMDAPVVFSTGKYRINRSSLILNAPVNVRINEIAKHKAKIFWDNTNGIRTSGYKLRIKNKTTCSEDELNVGDINEVNIPYYPDGTELEFTVCAYDGYGKQSEYTEPLALIIGGKKSKHNVPRVENKVITVNVERGNSKESKVLVSYDDWNTEETYILCGIKEEDKPFEILTREQLMELDESRIDIPLDITFQRNVLAREQGNEVEFSVFAAENCAPGEYTYECSVINENNYSSSSDFKVIVNVKNPKVMLKRIIPSKINGTEENDITVFGSGFVSGTKFYLNGQELMIPQNENNGFGTKTLRIPVLEKRGIYKLSAVGVDGDTKEMDLSVSIPDYDINLFMSKAKVCAGNEVKYALSAVDFEGYDGTASFKVKSVPEGFTVSTPVLGMRETGFITVSVGSKVASGEYNIVLETSNKNEIVLTAYVTNDVLVPTISSVSPARLYKGLETTVYGYGFTSSGNLMLNGERIRVTEWNDQYIRFIVPSDTPTGSCILVVSNENGKSEIFGAKVYENGFNVRIMKENVQVNSGEQQVVSVAVTGFAENINLSAVKDPDSPFTAELSKCLVSTNAVVDLVIDCVQETESGKYPVTIIATCGNTTIEKTLTVEIKNPFTITTEKLPKAYLGVPYSVQLENTEPEADVLWNVEQGTLPAGLTLSGSGRLSGVPEKQTTNVVTITAKKLNGIKASRKYTINIDDDIWATDNKNAGLIRSVISEIPADSQVEWISENASAIEHLYTQGTSIVALTSIGARVFNTNGILQWYTDDVYKQSFITKEMFYGLTRNNKLEAKSLITGINVWERKNVSSMISNGSILITKEGSSYYRIDIDNGTICETVKRGFHTVGQTLWLNDAVYEWKKNTLVPLYGAENTFKTSSLIYTAAADTEGFVVLTSNEIIVLDREFEIIKKLRSSNTKDVKLAITEKEIFIQNGDTVVKYDRNTLDVMWAVKGGEDIAAANEKLVITGEDCIKVLNSYTGKEIWSEKGNYSRIAIYRQHMYAAKDCTLIAYNGTFNANAPETNIMLNIEQPDGENGWYRTKPTVTITAEDKETYVDLIKYSHNSSEWVVYEETFTAAEGNNLVEAYALDSKNLKSETSVKEFKVDTIKPVTNYIPSIIQNTNGWYEDNVYVHLEAEDYGSGVASIETNKGLYKGAIAFTEEGEHLLKWQATDKAGNVEDLKSVVIKIDKYAPVTQSSIKSDKGITVVNISSWDSCSGIAYTEYCIDKGEVKVYEKPVVMLDEGWHKFEWRTFDVSGKTSDWQAIDVYVQKDNAEGNVLALTELNGEREAVEYPLDNSSTLFINNFTGNARIDKVTVKDFDRCYTNFYAYNTMHAVPSFILDSEYIKWKSSDMLLKGKKTIQYYLKKNAVMYMFASPEMEVSDTWKLIEEGVHIQDNWCKDGYKLYMRRAAAEECVEIVVQENIDVLPIIAVKEQPVINAELKLTRIDNWEDEYYGNRKPYRSGVQIAVTVKENTLECEETVPLSRKWTVEINGEVKPLVSGVYTIPELSEDTKIIFRYKVTAADGITEAMDVKTIIASPADNPSELNKLN